LSSVSEGFFYGILKPKDGNKMKKMTAILKIISYLYTLSSRIPHCRLIEVP